MNTQAKIKYKYVALLCFTFLLLLGPLGILAQTTPYYLAGGLTNFDDQMISQSNPVYVTMFGTDSLMILPELNDYKHAAAYKQTKGESFFRRTQAWSSQIPNFVFAYQKGIVLIEEGGSYLYFMKDRKFANQMLNTGGLSQAYRDSLRLVITSINNHHRAENGKAAEVQNKKIATAYIRRLHSARNDTKLMNDIKKWSGNSTTKVYITDANYTISRNQFGEVQSKSIRAFIKYNLQGKCYIQWDMFGYESLGKGHFSNDMTTFVSTYHYISVPGVGEMQLEPGEAQEVDCN